MSITAAAGLEVKNCPEVSGFVPKALVAVRVSGRGHSFEMRTVAQSTPHVKTQSP